MSDSPTPFCSFLPSHQPELARDQSLQELLQELSTTLPAQPSTLEVACDEESLTLLVTTEREGVPFVRRLCQWGLASWSLSTALIDDTLMILEECMSNVIRHSYPAEAAVGDRRFCLMLKRQGGALHVHLEDWGQRGHSADLAERLAAIPAQGRPPIRRGGMGLYLIKRMMDEVEYRAGDASHPNLLRLLKLIPERS